jgi:hypothetical protein
MAQQPVLRHHAGLGAADPRISDPPDQDVLLFFTHDRRDLAHVAITAHRSPPGSGGNSPRPPPWASSGATRCGIGTGSTAPPASPMWIRLNRSPCACPTTAWPASWKAAASVLSAFVRTVTHPRIFTPPTPLEDALAFVDGLRARPNCVAVASGPRHWDLFTAARRCAGPAAPSAASRLHGHSHSGPLAGGHGRAEHRVDPRRRDQFLDRHAFVRLGRPVAGAVQRRRHAGPDQVGRVGDEGPGR